MKLRTLAIAVAIATVPVAAQADLKISGDIGVRYLSNDSTGTTNLDQQGSEINFDASETVGGITYSGHAELEVPGGTVDEIRVGISGGFGSVTIGDLGDNGCGSLQTGGDNSVFMTHTIGGCADAGGNGIIYSRALGKMNMAVSHRLEDDADESSIGLSGAFGPAAFSVGYTTGATDTTAMGISGKVGPVSAGFRYGKEDGMDAVHGINLLYTTPSGLSVYGGLDTSDGDSKSFGIKKTVGMTDFIFEALDHGTDAVAGTDASGLDYAVGVRHRF